MVDGSGRDGVFPPMIRSMTGFGRADVSTELCTIVVEARSVNHRHLDLALRLPRSLASLEPRVRRVLSQRLERGRIDLSVQFGPGTGGSLPRVAIDAALAREYAERSRTLASELGLAGEPSLTWVLERSGVVRLEEPDLPDAEALWPTCEIAVTRAIDALIEQRTIEGGALAAELRALRVELTGHVGAMVARAPAGAARREERLRERIKALVEGAGVDEARILTEVAVAGSRRPRRRGTRHPTPRRPTPRRRPDAAADPAAAADRSRSAPASPVT